MATRQAEQLTDIKVQLAKIGEQLVGIVKSLNDLSDKTDAIHKEIYGNGEIGLKDDVRLLKKYYEQQISVLKRGALGILGILVAVTTGVVSEAVKTYYPDLFTRTEDKIVVEVCEEVSIAPAIAPIDTPSPTNTPAPTYTPTPEKFSISTDEKIALSALCWVECRGMDEQKKSCCASVIDTVYTRIAEKKMTDGTVIGTLRYGCDADTINCQFPAYVTRGCESIKSPCPFFDYVGMDFFETVIELYASGGLDIKCENYLFYGIQDFDTPECRIVSKNGQFLNFHNGISHE